MESKSMSQAPSAFTLADWQKAIEGGIGGLVNLRTALPFDFKGRKGEVSAPVDLIPPEMLDVKLTILRGETERGDLQLLEPLPSLD